MVFYYKGVFTLKTLYEIYIVKEENFINYKLINNKLEDNPNEVFIIGKSKIGIGTIGGKTKESISVNRNQLQKGLDYTISEGILNFVNPLEVGDKIIIKASILDNVKIVTKNSYSKDALFKVFSSDIKFKSNNRYNFILNINSEDFSSSFSTKYDPFYCNVKTIRTDTGDLLNNVTDEQIAKVIYNNSKEALERLETLDEMPEKTPTYAKNYVRYKTDIDFCYSIYLSMSGKIGSFSKTIGDIKIDTTYKIPYLGDMLSRFKELLAPNQDILNNGLSGSASVSFVRAQKTQYPVSNRGVF